MNNILREVNSDSKDLKRRIQLLESDRKEVKERNEELESRVCENSIGGREKNYAEEESKVRELWKNKGNREILEKNYILKKWQG